MTASDSGWTRRNGRVRPYSTSGAARAIHAVTADVTGAPRQRLLREGPTTLGAFSGSDTVRPGR